MCKCRNTLVVLGILLFSFCFFKISNYIVVAKQIEILGNTILFGTAIAIIWYTIETNELRRETIRQTDLSILPSLAISKTGKNIFQICNVGKGPANNIEFESPSYDDQLIFLIPDVLCLLPAEKATVLIKPILHGNDLSDSDLDFSVHLGIEYGIKQFNFSAVFEDLARQKYCQELELGKDGPYIGPMIKIS